MIVMFLAWKLFKRSHFVRRSEMDLHTDRYDGGQDDTYRIDEAEEETQRKGIVGKLQRFGQWLFF